MATFSCPVVRVTESFDHPNADSLSVVKVLGYTCITAKDQFKVGDLAVYIPVDSIVPEPILKELGLKGKLKGVDKNRVGAIRLRGIFSLGLLYPVYKDSVGVTYLEVSDEINGSQTYEVKEGLDASIELNITKYCPPIPTEMAGQVRSVGTNRTLSYDIENIRNYPDVIQEGEKVSINEKIHGTYMQVSLWPDGELIIASKGIASQGLAFKNNEENQSNLYIRAAKAYDIENGIRAALGSYLPVFVLGEVFGQGVQDLSYGYATTKDKIGFRIFDIYVGEPGKGEFLGAYELGAVCDIMDIKQVPVLYSGPFSQEILQKYTNGKETVSGQELHIREGVVVKPFKERTDPILGRVNLKAVSEDYYLRKGKVTEYQ